MQLTSTAFSEGAPIPAKHSCNGPDVSPAFAWQGVPGEARSLALIADDPDAPRGTWVHWVLFNIPPDEDGLGEDIPDDEQLANGSIQGKNDFGNIGYGGPCPPPGKPHRYFFKLYALDQMLDLKPGATKQDLLDAMDGHILAEGQLMGTFKR